METGFGQKTSFSNSNSHSDLLYKHNKELALNFTLVQFEYIFGMNPDVPDMQSSPCGANFRGHVLRDCAGFQNLFCRGGWLVLLSFQKKSPAAGIV